MTRIFPAKAHYRKGMFLGVPTTGAEIEHGDPIASDLAPGRALHPETWAFLLGRDGFDDVEVHTADAPATYAITAVRAQS